MPQNPNEKYHDHAKAMYARGKVPDRVQEAEQADTGEKTRVQYVELHALTNAVKPEQNCHREHGILKIDTNARMFDLLLQLDPSLRPTCFEGLASREFLEKGDKHDYLREAVFKKVNAGQKPDCAAFLLAYLCCYFPDDAKAFYGKYLVPLGQKFQKYDHEIAARNYQQYSEQRAKEKQAKEKKTETDADVFNDSYDRELTKEEHDALVEELCRLLDEGLVNQQYYIPAITKEGNYIEAELSADRGFAVLECKGIAHRFEVALLEMLISVNSQGLVLEEVEQLAASSTDIKIKHIPVSDACRKIIIENEVRGENLRDSFLRSTNGKLLYAYLKDSYRDYSVEIKHIVEPEHLSITRSLKPYHKRGNVNKEHAIAEMMEKELVRILGGTIYEHSSDSAQTEKDHTNEVKHDN